jgi:hypothetical protein
MSARYLIFAGNPTPTGGIYDMIATADDRQQAETLVPGDPGDHGRLLGARLQYRYHEHLIPEFARRVGRRAVATRSPLRHETVKPVNSPHLHSVFPTPNHPDDPPQAGESVAIWHATAGMIRGYYSDGWHALPGCPDIRGRLLVDSVLGWWPDPKPAEPHHLRCFYCDAEVFLPKRQDADGYFWPNYSLLPPGWTRDGPRPGAQWGLCPKHSGPFIKELPSA